MSDFFKNWIRSYRYTKILKVVEIPKRGTVLDLSCADGLFIKKLHIVAPDLKIFGIDISHTDIEKAKRDVVFAHVSMEQAEKLSFQNDSFDVVFSIMSLHHYENYEKVFSEVHRVLKKNGVLYLVDLIPKFAWSQKMWNWKGCPSPYHFGKFYSLTDLETMLDPCDFNIVSHRSIALVPRVRLILIRKRY